jgi:hypothetical protein
MKKGEDQLVGLEHWAERYRLEGILEQVYCKEEMYWQQSSDRWGVMGDVNTTFFHSSANGRRRNTKIHSLQDEKGCIINQYEIVTHIVQFYKTLFGSSPHPGAHLAEGF